MQKIDDINNIVFSLKEERKFCKECFKYWLITYK